MRIPHMGNFLREECFATKRKQHNPLLQLQRITLSLLLDVDFFSNSKYRVA